MKFFRPCIGCAVVIIFLLGCALSSHALSVFDGSFELRPAGSTFGGTFTFATTNAWTINHGSYQSAQNGITPLLGTNMVRFDEGGPETSTDIYQLIDVSALGSQINAGQVTFALSASFNSPLAHGFGLTILAYFETAVPLSVNSFDGIAQTPLFTTLDADSSTWQQLTLNFTPPPGTHFLAVGLDSKVDGHVSYADAVELTVVPEPSVTAFLFGASGFCFLRRIRR